METPFFLPAAGLGSGTLRKLRGEYGGYWSSSPHDSDSTQAYVSIFLIAAHTCVAVPATAGDAFDLCQNKSVAHTIHLIYFRSGI